MRGVDLITTRHVSEGLSFCVSAAYLGSLADASGCDNSLYFCTFNQPLSQIAQLQNASARGEGRGMWGEERRQGNPSLTFRVLKTR